MLTIHLVYDTIILIDSIRIEISIFKEGDPDMIIICVFGHVMSGIDENCIGIMPSVFM
jgi:hypothetical protein